MAKVGVVAFAFGTRRNPRNPNQDITSNRRVARIAISKSFDLGAAPIFTQGDVLIENYIPAALKDCIHVNRVSEESGDPPPTLQIVRGAIQWARGLGLTELWVAAAEPHLKRCLRDLNDVVQEEGAQIAVRACEECTGWFCPESAQTRVRSWWRWWLRELILLCMPMRLYRRVVS